MVHVSGVSPQRWHPAAFTRHASAAAILTLLASAVYGSIAWGLFVRFDDFADHIEVARHLYETGRPAGPHFLFHALTAGLFASHAVPSLASAARVVMVGCYALTGLVAYGFLWSALRDSRIGRPVTLALSGFVILLAQPITLSQTYALGYFWPEPYHSPTFALLKPIALAGFGATAWCFAAGRTVRPGFAVLFALTTLTGSLSKPSFTICLLPATAILIIYRLARRLPVSLVNLLAGLYVPATLVLAWQFYQTYSGYGSDTVYHNTIVWAPFKVMSASATGLVGKFLLSVVFPLSVLGLYWKRARNDAMLQLAWLCFLCGTVYSYMLAEAIDWRAGNFLWSGYITLWTLFVASAVFWLREVASAKLHGWHLAGALVCGGALTLHAVSGARLALLYLLHYGCNVSIQQAAFVCGP